MYQFFNKKRVNTIVFYELNLLNCYNNFSKKKEVYIYVNVKILLEKKLSIKKMLTNDLKHFRPVECHNETTIGQLLV